MRKFVGLLIVLILGCTMAIAQANSSQSSSANAQSSQGSAQTPMTAPRTTRGDRDASAVDRGTPANQSSTAADQRQAQNGQPTSTSPQTPVENPSATQRASNTGGGVPWGWIIVGIIVIAIILALIGRGSDRTVVRREREIERDRMAPPTDISTRRDDDIRRVG